MNANINLPIKTMLSYVAPFVVIALISSCAGEPRLVIHESVLDGYEKTVYVERGWGR